MGQPVTRRAQKRHGPIVVLIARRQRLRPPPKPYPPLFTSTPTRSTLEQVAYPSLKTCSPPGISTPTRSVPEPSVLNDNSPPLAIIIPTLFIVVDQVGDLLFHDILIPTPLGLLSFLDAYPLLDTLMSILLEFLH